VAFAHELGLPDEQIHEVAVGGVMHDIGKTLVPPDVLNKPAKLNNDEFAQIKEHVSLGEALLQQVPDLSESARDVASLHHERMDGRGYPA
jgi:HD-GYP domain-containing protein (c-di-GMP phosphodiesterase class II)